MKNLTISGIFLLLLVNPFLAEGQSAKDFQSFGWGVYSHSLSNIFSVFRNEAGLATIKHFTAGVLAERRFMLNAISSYAFAAALPAASGTFCFDGNTFGFENFRRTRTGLSYGRKLTSWLDVGIQVDYLNMRVPDYGNARAVTFDLAAMIHWNEHWQTGLQVFNPVRIKYNGLGNDVIPAIYRIGVGYQPSDAFLLSAEISRTGKYPIEGTVAFHYRIIKNFGFMGGISTGEEKIFLGMKIYLKKFQMIFAAAYHSRLGLSPAAGFIYRGNNTSQKK